MNMNNFIDIDKLIKYSILYLYIFYMVENIGQPNLKLGLVHNEIR